MNHRKCNTCFEFHIFFLFPVHNIKPKVKRKEENTMAKYKIETIRKMLDKANEMKGEIMKDLSSYHVSISNGNSKIGKVMNVSTMPILACGNCEHCMEYCYDVKACVRFVNNVLFNRMKNFLIAKYDRERYFAEIRNKLSKRKKNFYFRWHVAGDILDYEYFLEMVAIANEFPHFRFWTYTKMYSIVNRYIAESGSLPKNFVVMYSEWDGVQLDNPFNNPTFSVKMAAGNKNHPAEYFNHIMKCPGNCDFCKNHHCGCVAGMNVYADEH